MKGLKIFAVLLFPLISTISLKSSRPTPQVRFSVNGNYDPSYSPIFIRSRARVFSAKSSALREKSGWSRQFLTFMSSRNNTFYRPLHYQSTLKRQEPKSPVSVLPPQSTEPSLFPSLEARTHRLIIGPQFRKNSKPGHGLEECAGCKKR